MGCDKSDAFDCTVLNAHLLRAPSKSLYLHGTASLEHAANNAVIPWLRCKTINLVWVSMCSTVSAAQTLLVSFGTGAETKQRYMVNFSVDKIKEHVTSTEKGGRK